MNAMKMPTSDILISSPAGKNFHDVYFGEGRSWIHRQSHLCGTCCGRVYPGRAGQSERWPSLGCQMGATVSHRAAQVFEGRRGSRDPPALIADPQPARSLLRWTPLKPDLHKVVRTAWQWCRTRVFEPTEKQKLKSTLV